MPRACCPAVGLYVLDGAVFEYLHDMISANLRAPAPPLPVQPHKRPLQITLASSQNKVKSRITLFCAPDSLTRGPGCQPFATSTRAAVLV